MGRLSHPSSSGLSSRVSRTRGVIGLAALAASCAQPTKNCFEKYQCVFHYDIGGQEYSWDLHQLCHEEADYVNHDTTGHTTYFKICGNASQTCAPGYPTYDTHGVAIQVFDEGFKPCYSTTPKDCTDYDFQVPTCCTGQCYILGNDFFQFNLLDESNPGRGVKLVHPGSPSIPNDPFKCPPNPSTLLEISRSVVITILCDTNVPSSAFVIDTMVENQSCQYNIIGRSSAACGNKNDSFCPACGNSPQSIPAGYISDGAIFGVAFGSAVIAGGLTLLIYVVGESRAWWGSIKMCLPASLTATVTGRDSFAAHAGSGANLKVAYSSVGSAYGEVY